MSIDHAIDTSEEFDHSDPASKTHAKHGHGLTDKGYVGVALLLAVMTGAEVGLSYSPIKGGAFMALLLVLMALKFWTVVSFFMHLRFDNRIFTWLFYSGLLLAVFVYVAALLTFQFFAKS